jgi:hypothetical protein
MEIHPAFRVLLTVVSLGFAGCSSGDWSREPLPVSVSAANYSQLSMQERYQRVNATGTDHPTPPEVPVPAHPMFYGFVPGEVYDSDVPIDTVYRELAVPLAHRGYFNVLYEAKAGRLPDRIDYLLRIHCGVRRWRTPTVRTDKVTWGDSGLSSSRPNPDSMYRIGEGSNYDPRAGLDPHEIVDLATYLQSFGTTAGSAQRQYSVQNLNDGGASRDYAVVVVEAFRFSDVATMKNRAPCVWATFVAVPLHSGQELSGVIRAMARTATPYFGTTSDGLQRFEVPNGNVLVGNPVEVPGPPPAGKTSP